MESYSTCKLGKGTASLLSGRVPNAPAHPPGEIAETRMNIGDFAGTKKKKRHPPPGGYFRLYFAPGRFGLTRRQRYRRVAFTTTENTSDSSRVTSKETCRLTAISACSNCCAEVSTLVA